MTARAVAQALTIKGFDVFLDYDSIDSGSFEKIILGEIAARAHFITILTPSAMERINEPGDWLRREIELAIDHQRNIIPLMFEGFRFNDFANSATGKLKVLGEYNGPRVPSDFFDAAIEKLVSRFLDRPLVSVLHPTLPDSSGFVERQQNQTETGPKVTDAQLEAEQYFERAMARDEQDVEGKIVDYTEAIHLDPEFAHAYINRGFYYHEQGQYDLAIADASEAIRLDPESELAYVNRAVAYDEQGQYDLAIADLSEAIRLDPLLVVPYLNRGFAYHQLGQYDAAIADYREAIRLDPENAFARAALKELNSS